MNTYWKNNYLENYTKYIREIVDLNPDFLIPVARKSCKLFKSIEPMFDEVKHKIFYLDYFKYTPINLKNKKISIFDDAVNRTSTLHEYREFFKKLGVKNSDISTYGFIGHEQLIIKPELKCDKYATIFNYASSPIYKKYILSQSNHILVNGSYPDLDHLILELEISNFNNTTIDKIWEFSKRLGYRYQLDEINGLHRFGVHINNFCDIDLISEKLGINIESDLVQKFRFTINSNSNRFTLTPMCFPKYYSSKDEICNIDENIGKYFNIKLPCSHRNKHVTDKFCYLSICYLLNILLIKKFYYSLKKNLPDTYSQFRNFRIKRSDIIRYFGEKLGDDILQNARSFLQSDDEKIYNIFDTAKNSIDLSPIPFRRENVSNAIYNLRQEYSNAVKKNKNNPVGVKVTKPVDYFTKDHGIHPLIFTEILDEFCDYGTLVPQTSYNSKSSLWYRTYRTGEDWHEMYAWQRSRRLISLAINNIDPEGVPRMYLEKVFANFCHDFKSHLEDYDKNAIELHCFRPVPSYWGTQNFVYEPADKIQYTLTPKDLFALENKYGKFLEFIQYDKSSKHYIPTNPVQDLHKWFGNHRYYSDYFSFLKDVKNKFNTVESLNSLALCRSIEWYNIHIKFNLLEWMNIKSYQGFLKNLSKGIISRKHLDSAYRMAVSASDKIKCLYNLPKVIEESQKIAHANPQEYTEIWDSINNSFDTGIFKHSKSKVINEVIVIINAMKALDGITRIKLNLTTNPKTIEKVNNFAQDEFDVLDIDIDVNELLKNRFEAKMLSTILEKIYLSIKTKILQLSLPDISPEIIDRYTTNEFSSAVDKINLMMPKEQSFSIPIIAECIEFARDHLEMVNPRLKNYIKVTHPQYSIIVKLIDELDETCKIGVNHNGFIKKIKINYN